MTDAYVNIVAEPGAVMGVAREVGELDEVASVHVVTGEYDLIAQLELDDPDDLPTVVADSIHGIQGIAATYTNVAYEPR